MENSLSIVVCCVSNHLVGKGGGRGVGMGVGDRWEGRREGGGKEGVREGGGARRNMKRELDPHFW